MQFKTQRVGLQSTSADSTSADSTSADSTSADSTSADSTAWEKGFNKTYPAPKITTEGYTSGKDTTMTASA